MDFTQADIDALAAKLAAADLTEGEQAVMAAAVDAAEGEVSGFGMGLSFAPLEPAEFLLAHEVNHSVQNQSGVVKSGGGSSI
jgi:hypothetical protein